MTPTNNKLKVQDVEINIRVINEADYISLIPLNSGELKMKQDLTVLYYRSSNGWKNCKRATGSFLGWISRIFFGFRWILLGSFMGTEFSI